MPQAAEPGPDGRPPFRPLDAPSPAVTVEERADGTLILRSPRPLGDCERNVVAYLRRGAAAHPDRILLAERRGDRSWRALRWGEARAEVDRLAAALLRRGLGPERPLMILSGNSIEHATLTLAGMTVGVPVVPVSVAWSLMSQDHGKLRHVFDLVRPGLIFVQNGAVYARALAALDLDGVEVVVATAPPDGLAATGFEDLRRVEPDQAVEDAYSATGPDTVAKILFTSGSTGFPKGVINTQRMLCANQRMAGLIWTNPPDDPPVLLEWLPWNHTFGGNYNFHNCLRQGGTLYIDGGRPLPGMFEETLANLREVAPTSYANVPAGFAMLVPYLEAEPALRDHFFSRLKFLSYGGAGLPEELFERVQALAVQATGRRIAFISGWGSTETAPTVTTVHWVVEGTGIIGLPFPGAEVKMVPLEPEAPRRAGKYELRVRGPIVTPGYLKRPDLTAAAFDEEGFYLIGDAGRLVDPEEPLCGLRFDGRVAEDFKLDTGTWVHVGALRLAALGAAAPLLQDAAIAGQDRPYVALLAWPNLAACRRLCAAPETEPVEALIRRPELRERLRQGLSLHNGRNSGGASRIARLLLMAEPPSIDAGEITDKGYVNQRLTLERRRRLVEALYAEPAGEDVIVV